MTGMRPQVFFINRFFHPDQSATAQILSDLAIYLSEQNLDLHIITSRASVTDKLAWYEKSATWRSIQITRVSTTRFGRDRLAGRLIDYLTFYIATFLAAIRLLRKGDIVVAKTDPPMLSVPIEIAASLKGAFLINWLQDLFPEVAERAGMGLANGPIGGILKWLRNRSLRKATMNVAIGDLMRDKIIAEGIAAQRVRVIPNFCDDETVVPAKLAAQRLRSSWGFADSDFVVEYSGNLGRAHDTDTMLGAAQLLKNHPQIRFLFVGGGHQKEALAAKAEVLGITSFYFRPYQDRSELSASLGVGDFHWMSLRPEMEGLIVPSKYFGIAAAGKPVLMIGDKQGEIGKIIEKHKCGVVVEPGESRKVADELLKLSEDHFRLDRMGAAAREYIEQQGARRYALDSWEQLLRSKLAQKDCA